MGNKNKLLSILLLIILVFSYSFSCVQISSVDYDNPEFYNINELEKFNTDYYHGSDVNSYYDEISELFDENEISYELMTYQTIIGSNNTPLHNLPIIVLNDNTNYIDDNWNLNNENIFFGKEEYLNYNEPDIFSFKIKTNEKLTFNVKCINNLGKGIYLKESAFKHAYKDATGTELNNDDFISYMSDFYYYLTEKDIMKAIENDKYIIPSLRNDVSFRDLNSFYSFYFFLGMFSFVIAGLLEIAIITFQFKEKENSYIINILRGNKKFDVLKRDIGKISLFLIILNTLSLTISQLVSSVMNMLSPYILDYMYFNIAIIVYLILHIFIITVTQLYFYVSLNNKKIIGFIRFKDEN